MKIPTIQSFANLAVNNLFLPPREKKLGEPKKMICMSITLATIAGNSNTRNTHTTDT
jgi:hypothetical protein